MYPRTNYEMTEDDHKKLLDACMSSPCMMIGSYVTPSPQENANRAWQALGEKMGFDYMTVQPIEGKGTRFFTAVPLETAEARKERLEREATELREREIKTLESEIAELKNRLETLQQRS